MLKTNSNITSKAIGLGSKVFRKSGFPFGTSLYGTVRSFDGGGMVEVVSDNDPEDYYWIPLEALRAVPDSVILEGEKPKGYGRVAPNYYDIYRATARLVRLWESEVDLAARSSSTQAKISTAVEILCEELGIEIPEQDLIQGGECWGRTS
jgi:hypothetical protein